MSPRNQGALCLALLAGCGPSTTGEPGVEAGEIADHRVVVPPPLVAEEGVQFLMPETVIPAGEERMVCWMPGWVPDQDVLISRYESLQGPLGHHTVALRSGVPRDPGDSFDCTDLESMVTLEPLILPDLSDTPLLPENFALRLPAGAQVVIQSHYVNTTARDILVADVARLHFAPTAVAQTEASYLILNHSNIRLPRGEAVSTLSCPIQERLELLLLLGHMHEWGVSIELELERDGVRRTLYEVDEWTVEFRDLPPVLHFGDLGAPQQLLPGDVLHMTCHHAKSSAGTLRFPSEMCTMVGYYFPALDEGIVLCSGGEVESSVSPGSDDGPGEQQPPRECPADLPPASDPCLEGCGNSLGIGQPCSAGGGECGGNSWPAVFCTADFNAETNLAFCTGACSEDGECGPGALCMGDPTDSSSTKGCVPARCTDEPRLSVVQARAFSPSCAFSSCHGGGSPARGLDLSEGRAFESLVGVASGEPGWTRVVAGESETSLLLKILEVAEGSTARMPPGGSLAPADIDLVRAWIDAGAANN